MRFVLLIATMLVAPLPAAAQDIVYSGTLRGELVVTGNTLGLDANSATQPGVGGAIGTFIANPATHAASQEGTYPVGTTADFNNNGSEAVLDLPAAATVVHAELVWACSSQNGGSPTNPALSPPEVFLTLPSGARETVTPDGENAALTLVSTAYRYYQRWADVTAKVQTGGAGRYAVSRVAGTQFVDATYISGCGWSLVVVYAHPDLPMRNITVWNIGQEVRDDGETCPCTAQIEVAGFCTPSDGGNANGRLVVTALEGDARFTDDELQIADPVFPGDFYPLSGPNNAYDNFFASQINGSDGLLDTRGTFGMTNHAVDPLDGATVTLVPGARQSWDVTTIPLNDDEFNPLVLANGQSETSFVATSGGVGAAEGDDYIIVAMGLALDFEAPDLASVHVADKAVTWAGDEVTYTVTLINEGSGRADQSAFCFEGSPNSTFLSLSLDGQEQAGVSASTIAPSACQAATGGLAIGAFEPAQEKVLALRYRVDVIDRDHQDVRGTPSWRMEWRPDCDGAEFEVDRQVGALVVVPGYALEAVLTVDPTTPPAAESGDTLTYTLTITNVGAADAPAGVTARLAIPPSTQYVAGSTTLNGQAVADSGGMPFVNGALVQSQGAAAGVVAAGASAVVVFQVTIVAPNATTITETGRVDPDGAGGISEFASNSVFTAVDGPVSEDDQDKDGIPDSRDNCPTVPNPLQEDNYPPPAGNGIGDACDDVDKDGILDLDEDLGPDGERDTADDTDPMNPDTDGDGLCDGNKLVQPCVDVEDVDGDFDGTDRGTVETDPTNPDTDGDGLCDGFQNGGDCLGGEDVLSSDPLDTDTDDDGLCDGPGGGAWDASGCVGSETGLDGDLDEGVDTDPTNPDTDGDGLCDGFNNGATTCRGAEDKDGDRDAADLVHPGGSESDPLDPDTDDGGVPDGTEFDAGTNPRDACEGDLQDCTPAELIAEGGACSGGGTSAALMLALAALGLLMRHRTSTLREDE